MYVFSPQLQLWHQLKVRTRGDAVVVTLLEEDIEGALLEEPLKTKTIPQLHWWLLCIKAPLNDTKPAQLKRYGK